MTNSEIKVKEKKLEAHEGFSFLPPPTPPPPPYSNHLGKIPESTHLIRGQVARVDEQEELQQDFMDSFHVAEAVEDHGSPGEKAGVSGGINPAVSNGPPEDVESDASGLIGDHISLQLVDRPDVVEHVLNDRCVREERSGVPHLVILFISFLSKERDSRTL
jgi:hypothetical protein